MFCGLDLRLKDWKKLNIWYFKSVSNVPNNGKSVPKGLGRVTTNSNQLIYQMIWAKSPWSGNDRISKADFQDAQSDGSHHALISNSNSNWTLNAIHNLNCLVRLSTARVSWELFQSWTSYSSTSEQFEPNLNNINKLNIDNNMYFEVPKKFRNFEKIWTIFRKFVVK